MKDCQWVRFCLWEDVNKLSLVMELIRLALVFAVNVSYYWFLLCMCVGYIMCRCMLCMLHTYMWVCVRVCVCMYAYVCVSKRMLQYVNRYAQSPLLWHCGGQFIVQKGQYAWEGYGNCICVVGGWWVLPTHPVCLCGVLAWLSGKEWSWSFPLSSLLVVYGPST